MPVSIQDEGRNNQVSIDPRTMEQSQASILLRGDNNRVMIAAGVTLLGGSVILGGNCSLEVGADCRLAAIEVMGSRDAHVRIGPRCDFTWSTRIYLHEPGRIELGADCLVASGTLLTNSDMHSILDRETGQRINPAADIHIGDKVWLAHEATVLKGARIGEDSVIGHRSIVSGSVPPGSLAVGVPARVVRSGVVWDRRLL